MNEVLQSTIARWEVGSEFPCSDDAGIPSLSENLFPETYELFSTATGILLAIERFLKGDYRYSYNDTEWVVAKVSDFTEIHLPVDI